MTWQAIAAIVAAGTVLDGIYIAILHVTMMVEEMNRQRRDEDLVSNPGFSVSKMLLIYRDYRTTLPEGRLHLKALAIFCASLVGLIGLAVLLRNVR